MTPPDAARAVFFDGASNRRQPVSLLFGATLEILGGDGTVLATWRYADVRAHDAPPELLRLGCVDAPELARLEVRDPGQRQAVAERCGSLRGRGGAETVSVARIVGWSLAAVGAIVLVILFVLPPLADRVAEIMPEAWDRALGQAADKQVRVIFSGPECTQPEGRAALLTLVGRLQTAAHLPIAPDPVVLRSAVPNAFALPGGRVYVLSALLRQAESPDELGGVLAHEFGHVAHRDGVRRLVRDGGTGFLAGLLLGDITGAGAILFAVRSVLSAAYSRDVEAAADGSAIATMQTLGRPTAPLGNLLRRIGGSAEERFSLLRDHPLTPERVERLRVADAAASGPPLLTPAEWQALQGICGTP